MERAKFEVAEEARDLPRVAEPRANGTGSDGAKEEAGAGWLEDGVEDPAFFIKPADQE